MPEKRKGFLSRIRDLFSRSRRKPEAGTSWPPPSAPDWPEDWWIREAHYPDGHTKIIDNNRISDRDLDRTQFVRIQYGTNDNMWFTIRRPTSKDYIANVIYRYYMTRYM